VSQKKKTFRGDKSSRYKIICTCYLCTGSKKDEQRDNKAKFKAETMKEVIEDLK